MVLLRPCLIDFTGTHGVVGTFGADGTHVDMSQCGCDEQQCANAMNNIGDLHCGASLGKVGEVQNQAGNSDHQPEDELICSSGESVRGVRASAPSRAYSSVRQPEGRAALRVHLINGGLATSLPAEA